MVFNRPNQSDYDGISNESKPRRLEILFALVGVLLFLFLFIVCKGVFATFSGIALLLCFLWFLHRSLDALIPRWHRRVDQAIIGLLALTVGLLGAYGIHQEREELRSKESNRGDLTWDQSVQENAETIYEVAQLFLLNTSVDRSTTKEQVANPKQQTMAPLEQEETEDARILAELLAHEDVAKSLAVSKPKQSNLILAIARILAVVFAILLAYRVIETFFRGTVDRVKLFIYGVIGPRPYLVIGLGFVGMQLVRELRDRRIRVIVIESNPENPNIALARELGALVVVGDAFNTDLIRDIEFDRIADVYVVAGSDDTNLRIATLLKNASEADLSDGLLSRAIHFLVSKCDSKCYVRLYDPDLYLALDQIYTSNSGASSNFTFLPFNTDQNAVRQLIQRQLIAPEIRPKEAKEVGTWIIAGFGAMGQEVALGLARLAHFENNKRSRIAILGDNNSDAIFTRFNTKYPKFTCEDKTTQKYSEIQFKEELDRWDFNSNVKDSSPDSNRGIEFATQTRFARLPDSPDDPSFLGWIRKLVTSNGETTIKPALFVCFEDEGVAFAWASQFRRAFSEYCYRNMPIDVQDREPNQSVLPIFVWLPYQRTLRDLSSDFLGTKDDFTTFRVFGQIEEVASLQAINDPLRPKLANVVNNSYDRALEQIKLRSGAGDEPPIPLANAPYPEALLRNTSYLDTISNLFAADHALIKYAIATEQSGNSIVELTRSNSPENSTPTTRITFKYPNGENAEIFRPQFVGEEWNEKDMNSPKPTEDALMKSERLIDKLAAMEHNRWSSEMLLRNYSWVEKEQRMTYVTAGAPNGKSRRIPQHVFCRETLVAWEDQRLSSQEKLKDQLQTYYILSYLYNAIGVVPPDANKVPAAEEESHSNVNPTALESLSQTS